MEPVPRIRLTTFNTHWGGTQSDFASFAEFAKARTGRPNACGVDDPHFVRSVEAVLNRSDVACFQEFPLRWDRTMHCLVPDIETVGVFRNFNFYVEPTLNTAFYDQSNTPEPLRGTGRDIGLVVAVRNCFHSRQIDTIEVPRQNGDLVERRRFPVVEVEEVCSGTTMLIANVYGQSPNMSMSFAGAAANLNDAVHALNRSPYRAYSSVMMAGDFNLTRRHVEKIMQRNGRNNGVQVANVGSTFPTMTMPNRDKATSTFTEPRYALGMQLDHLVCLRGASFAKAHILRGIASNSDHMPVVGLIDVFHRIMQGSIEHRKTMER